MPPKTPFPEEEVIPEKYHHLSYAQWKLNSPEEIAKHERQKAREAREARDIAFPEIQHSDEEDYRLEAEQMYGKDEADRMYGVKKKKDGLVG